MSDFERRYGPWAVIAGGSEGLGLALARGCLRRGLRVLISSHDRDSLDEARRLLDAGDRLATSHGDLSTPAGVETLLADCADREVGLLIANAAVAPRGDFLDRDPDELVAAVRVNVEAPVRLARQLGTGMRDRGRGGIVLVSSLSSLNGTPVFSTYAGTKAFLRVQAEGLWHELRGHGVDVLGVVPGTIDTPGLRRSAPRGGPAPASADDIAEAALDNLGNGPVLFPSRRDRLSAALLTRVLPRRTAIDLTGRTTRRMYDR